METCPCCNEEAQCLPDCTFADDDPPGHEQMVRDRLAEADGKALASLREFLREHRTRDDQDHWTAIICGGEGILCMTCDAEWSFPT